MDYALSEVAQFSELDGTKIGLMIRCPNCGARHGAWFKIPIGGGESPYSSRGWDRVGETLETITLHPSFLAVDHYHSWIRNGHLCIDSPFSCKTEASS